MATTGLQDLQAARTRTQNAINAKSSAINTYTALVYDWKNELQRLQNLRANMGGLTSQSKKDAMDASVNDAFSRVNYYQGIVNALTAERAALYNELNIIIDGIDGYNEAVENYVSQGIEYGGSVEIAASVAEGLAAQSMAAVDNIEAEGAANLRNLDEEGAAAQNKKIISRIALTAAAILLIALLAMSDVARSLM